MCVSAANSTTTSAASRQKAALACCERESSVCFRPFFLAVWTHLTSTQANRNSQRAKAPGGSLHLTLDGQLLFCLLIGITRRHIWFCTPAFPRGTELQLPPMESGHVTRASRLCHFCTVQVRPCNESLSQAGLLLWEPTPKTRGDLLAPRTRRARGRTGVRGAVIPQSHNTLKDTVLFFQDNFILGTTLHGGKVAAALPGFSMHSYVPEKEGGQESGALPSLPSQEPQQTSLWGSLADRVKWPRGKVTGLPSPLLWQEGGVILVGSRPFFTVRGRDVRELGITQTTDLWKVFDMYWQCPPENTRFLAHSPALGFISLFLICAYLICKKWYCGHLFWTLYLLGIDVVFLL